MSRFARWRRIFGGGGAGNRALLAMTLNNMTQGVVMFDANERLVVCNERYVEMYGLSPDVVKPGLLLLDLIEHRKLAGSLDLDAQAYRAEILASIAQGKWSSRIVETPDGRVVSVVNRRIKGSGFWIGTHDDITERIRAERQSAALSEQERRRVEVEAEIQAFRENVATVLRAVNGSTAALQAIAVALSDSSSCTAERTAGAVQSSAEASTNMTAAAKVAEELIASVAEISREIGQAAELVTHAVAEADSANGQMTHLMPRCRRSAMSSA